MHTPLAPPSRGKRGPAEIVTCAAGAAILEFALVLPILLALLGGCFEIGRALLVRQAMVEAVRGGARTLARIPDPDCSVACPDGAARAVAATRDQIAENAGLARADVNVSPLWDPGSDTVAMQADLALETDLLRIVGLGPLVRLHASHRERRIGE